MNSMRDIVCQSCAKSVSVSDTRQKYCSRSCAAKVNGTTTPKRKCIPRMCVYCTGTFIPSSQFSSKKVCPACRSRRDAQSLLDFAGASKHGLAISLIQSAAVEKCTKDEFYKKRADSANEQLAKARKELDTAYEDLRKAKGLLYQQRTRKPVCPTCGRDADNDVQQCARCDKEEMQRR